jgi:hypothetical protein
VWLSIDKCYYVRALSVGDLTPDRIHTEQFVEHHRNLLLGDDRSVCWLPRSESYVMDAQNVFKISQTDRNFNRIHVFPASSGTI